MKNLTLLSIVVLFFGQNLFSQCNAPTANTEIVTSSIATTITTGQLMFNDPQAGQASHEFPIGSGTHVFYSGGLWIGGLDSEGQLHLAATRYNANGNDYFPGPLTTDGLADATNCEGYDQFFTVTRAAAVIHRAYFYAIEAGTVDEQFPNGYTIPQEILDYPANGDTSLEEATYLAPFYDFDGDGYYDPNNGDYPLFDIGMEIQGCTSCEKLKGDEVTFWINNDTGNIHTETGGERIGIEIHNTTSTFNNVDGTLAENSTFYHKKIINRSDIDYTEMYISIYADVDIGNPTNDFIGCNTERNLGYGYNGTEIDPSMGGATGYGNTPPAAGIVILKGPLADPTGEDEDGDGILDNERIGMSKFMTYHVSGMGMNDPVMANEYYQYMKGVWKDGSPLTYGGNGHDSNTGVPTDYVFPDDYIMEGQEEWGESVNENVPGDRRFLITMGPFSMAAGEEICIEFATVIGEGENSGEAIQALHDNTDFVIEQFNNCYGNILESLEEILETVSVDETSTSEMTISVGQDNVLSINTTATNNQTISIVNALGQQVLFDSFVSTYSKKLHLAKGMYVVKVQQKNGISKTEKIMIR